MTQKEKEPLIAVSSCPVCGNHTVEAKGFVWVCNTCRYTQGRSYKKDAGGCWLGSRDARWQRVRYRQQHNLPYEKIFDVLPDTLVFGIEVRGEAYGLKADEYTARVGEEFDNGAGYHGLFGTLAHPSEESAISDLKCFLDAQEWNGNLVRTQKWIR